jgi:carboxyl-terminal processing protease
MPPRRRPLLLALGAAACLLSGYAVGVRQATPAPTFSQLSAPDQHAFGIVWETLGQLEREYYQRDDLDTRALAEGAARGMVESVGDPYTRLIDAQRAQLDESSLRGRFDGIGVQLDGATGQVRIANVVRGSPAERAGVLAGDLIAAIDDTDAGQLSLAEVARRLRGERGTPVALRVQRAARNDPIDMQITRDEVRLSSVETRWLDDAPGVAYVRISLFAEPTGQQLRQQLTSLLDSGARGIILDVRGNPGGYLSSAVDVTSAFVRDGVMLYQQRGPSSAERTAYRAAGNAVAADLPLAVLVDGRSASAAEIVAAALRENRRAPLIGQRTYGKGTVQEQHTLSDASELRVTVAQWLTPAGAPIQGHGLLPDVELAQSDDAIQAAVNILSNQVSHG